MNVMQPLSVIAFAALLVAGCGNKTGATEATEVEDAPPAKPALQRLSGTLSIVEDWALMDKAGAQVATRKMQLQGTIDQLVRVSEDSEGSLSFETDGNVPLKMSGTISESGQLAYDKPDDNMIVKGRGQSAWTGKLDPLDFTVRRSKLGAGDEITLRFGVPMTGKLETKLTTRDGTVIDMPLASAGFVITLLEDVPDQADKRIFKRDFDLMPALGPAPSDALAKMMYDAMKANPGMAHTGLVTSLDRQSWTYSGTKLWGKQNGETKWVETAKLSLKLTKP